jgi:cell division septum initiation protein DivIVA
VIAELYQENRELRRRLAEKDQEIPSSQGHVGSTVWLQRRLREAQDTIVQLREAQRTTEEKDTVQGTSSNLGKGSCAGEA